MNTDENKHTLNSKIEPKTSKLAIWSVVLGIISFFTLTITAMPAVICGIIGMVNIRKSNGRLKGLGLAVFGIVVSVVSIPIGLKIIIPDTYWQYKQSQVCVKNLSTLGKALMAYAKDHNDRYPEANNWCDVLIRNYNVSPKTFLCPLCKTKKGQSCYAMNINIAGKKTSNVSVEVVMIFETKPGINPAGGPELVSTENHPEGGSGFLFGDGWAKFEKFGKGTPADLPWKLEE